MPSRELFIGLVIGLTSLFIIMFIGLALMFSHENEKQAVRKSNILAFISLIIGSAIYLLNLEIVFYSLFVLGIISILALIFPYSANPEFTGDIPETRVDERDIMFSRKELIPGSEKYTKYYQRRPELEPLDNAFRSEPGLLRPRSIHYHKKAFKAAADYFTEVDKLHEYVTGNPNREKIRTESSVITREIKELAKELGVLDIGVAETRPYHFYTYKGRGSEYGDKIDVIHKYAIAFTVEMTHEMVMAAPKASIVMESAKQYLSAGTIATELAKKSETWDMMLGLISTGTTN